MYNQPPLVKGYVPCGWSVSHHRNLKDLLVNLEARMVRPCPNLTRYALSPPWIELQAVKS
jgi:hypothetical protein